MTLILHYQIKCSRNSSATSCLYHSKEMDFRGMAHGYQVMVTEEIRNEEVKLEGNL